MSDYLKPEPGTGLHEVSTLGLAHVGDAVYELMARTWLYETGVSTARSLHGGATRIVSAHAQAQAASRLLPVLNEDEIAVFKRGRNAHVHTVPRGSSFEEYHAATGVEALFGYLYLSGKLERLNELFELIIEDGKD